MREIFNKLKDYWEKSRIMNKKMYKFDYKNQHICKAKAPVNKPQRWKTSLENIFAKLYCKGLYFLIQR